MPRVVVVRARLPGRIGNTAACDERLDLGFFIHAQAQRFVGGSRYSPTMSWTLSMNSGSLDSLKSCSDRLQPERAPDAAHRGLTESLRFPWRAYSNAWRPAACVPGSWGDPRSTSTSVIFRRAPARFIRSPCRRFRTKRCRSAPRLPRDAGVAAISPLVWSRHTPGRGARVGQALRVVGRRAHCSSVCRSSAVSTTSGLDDRKHRRPPCLHEERRGKPVCSVISNSGTLVMSRNINIVP